MHKRVKTKTNGYIRNSLYPVCVVLLSKGALLQLKCSMQTAKRNFAKIEVELLVELFFDSSGVSKNMPGPAQVGATSKAQK